MIILKNKKFLITVSVILILLGIGYFLEWKYEKEWSPYTEYKLSKMDSIALFGATPKDFFNEYEELNFYSTLGDLRTNAEIDKYGNLILRLTDAQINRLFEMTTELVEKSKEPYAISDDYKSFVVKLYDNHAIAYDMASYPLMLPLYLMWHQLLTVGNPGEISVTIMYEKAESGEVLYTLKLPYQSIHVEKGVVEIKDEEIPD